MNNVAAFDSVRHKRDNLTYQCVTLTFAERNRLSLSLSGNKPLSAN